MRKRKAILGLLVLYALWTVIPCLLLGSLTPLFVVTGLVVTVLSIVAFAFLVGNVLVPNV